MCWGLLGHYRVAEQIVWRRAPPTCKSPHATNSSCKWKTSSASRIATKRSDTIQGCFLRQQWLRLSARPAPPSSANRLFPACVKASLCALIFRHTSAFRPAIYFIRFISLFAARRYPPHFTSRTLQKSVRLDGVGLYPRSPSTIKDWYPHWNNITEELRERG
jgi:hypothetical protein